MKHNAIFFVADNRTNKLMKMFDLCDAGKVYYQPMSVSFRTPTPVNEDYIYNIINKSKDSETLKGDWIPAIEYAGVLYVHKDITQLSDGKNIIFCKQSSLATSDNKKEGV